MPIETLRDAWKHRWTKITVRCDFGKRDHMKSIRECHYRAELDVHTLLWTRGPNFPLERLASRLMCPACGPRKVELIYHVPLPPGASAVKA